MLAALRAHVVSPQSAVRGWIVGIIALVFATTAFDRAQLGRSYDWLAWGPILLCAWLGHAAYRKINPFGVIAGDISRVSNSLSAWAENHLFAVTRFVWGLIVNVVTFVVMLVVLNSSSAQPILLAALVIIYVTVVTQFMMLQRQNIAISMKADSQFVELLNALDHPDKDQMRETLKEDRETMRATNARFWLNVAFLSVEWFTALYFLFQAI
jgi:ABC-type multidrug transport system fused ATPase/permease subunit